MKKYIAFLIMLILLYPLGASAASSGGGADKALEEEFNKGIDASLEKIDLKDMEVWFEKQKEALIPLTKGKSLEEFIKDMAAGNISVEYGSVFEYMLSLFFDGVKKSVPLIIQIIVITVIFGVVSGFIPVFGESGVSKMAYYAQIILVGGISLTVFTQIFTEGTGLIDNISGFCTDFFPLLFLLLTALGGIASANVLKPAAAMLTGAISMYIKAFVMPFLILFCILVLINALSQQVKFKGFISLVKSFIKWALGIAFVVFLGIVAIQGLLGAGADGISIKAAKYTIDKAVPIIGGMFSDTVDMLIACSLLIKNAVGAAGILLIAGMILMPVFNLLAQYFLFKFAGALTEPAGNKDIASFLGGVSDVIMHLLVIILTAGAMFVITVSIITGAGNINIMLR